MIIIKDKMKKTEVFVPRSSEFDVAEYVTEVEFDKVNEQFKNEYATKEYVAELVGEINNALGEIIN